MATSTAEIIVMVTAQSRACTQTRRWSIMSVISKGSSFNSKIESRCGGCRLWCIRCDSCAVAGEGGGRMTRRIVSKKLKATKLILLWAYTTLSLATKFADASSNSGSSSSAPFLVASEIIVQSTEGNPSDANNINIQSNTAGSNQHNDGVDGSISGNQKAQAGSGTYVKSTGDDNSNEQMMGGGGAGGSGSDTDGEDDDYPGENSSQRKDDSQWNSDGNSRAQTLKGASFNVATSSDSTGTASQPLRTLKRLQAMLDDTDYATHTVAPETTIASTESTIPEAESTSPGSSQQESSQSQPAIPSTPDLGPEKLWTSKDRAKYRRTRRTEKQRQQQREIEDHHARKIRDIQRQRIIREERERKELEELRRKQAEVMERKQRYEEQKNQQQQRFMQYEEATDFTDDDTDTDGGKGFELPNLPVYLSDAETDDFSEETDDAPNIRQSRSIQPASNYVPPNPQQGYNQVATHQNMGQNIGMSQPYQYNYPQAQQNQPQRQQPQQANGPYQNYQQQYPPYSQQQPQQHQQQAMPQQYQYSQDNHQQMQQENQRQYEQQYVAWAQAAANGYFYPPPPHPNPNFQNQQAQQAQQQPVYQYPYAAQQGPQQNQGATYPAQQQQQHTYLAQPLQQGGPQSSASPYSSIPPQQYQPQPQMKQDSAVYQRSEQRSFHPGKSRVGNDSSLQQQQEEQHQAGPQMNNSELELSNTHVPMQGNTDSTAMTELMGVSETDSTALSEANTTISTTSSSSSIIGGQMGVQSAFISPHVSPLTSPISSNRAVMGPINAEGPYCELEDESEVLISGTESKITFDSIQKLSFATIGVALLSYCAVSPRSLPFPEYNRLFLQNLSIVWLAAIAPLVSLLAVYDGKYNNINTAIGTFHVSFTLGYALAFISEVVVTTAVRLGVFKIWEPAIFELTPEVPSIILPWVLREKQYKPKRITLFAADFGASCVASPIIEEYLKLKIVQWTCKLPRNFKHTKKIQKGKKRRKQNTLQPVRSIDSQQVTNINCYVTQMLAASLGLKLMDITRRILMYTKENDNNKRIYAVMRGTFPIHELCGTMTTLLLARRDVIGVNLPVWKILGPAVFIHGMANFRGMKPIFKWNSSTPWSEMQLNRLEQGNDSIWKQLLPKSYSKIVWWTILFRVFGFCIKNYYLIGRQAMKRTTTYSGKLHAFNAKLHTDAMLKKAKD